MPVYGRASSVIPLDLLAPNTVRPLPGEPVPAHHATPALHRRPVELEPAPIPSAAPLAVPVRDPFAARREAREDRIAALDAVPGIPGHLMPGAVSEADEARAYGDDDSTPAPRRTPSRPRRPRATHVPQSPRERVVSRVLSDLAPALESLVADVVSAALSRRLES